MSECGFFMECIFLKIPSVDMVTIECLNEADLFHELYQVTGPLSEGGFGTIYSGFRRDDNFPIAIKQVKSHNTRRRAVWLNGNMTSVPSEVGLLIEVGAFFADNLVTPEIVDWYEVSDQIIIVLERPDPCMDLVDYVNSMDEVMTEEEAKLIFRQLVDAALHIRACNVFHRDIKPENILIETGHPKPRARFIDFGCGIRCDPDEILTEAQGTDIYLPPEYYMKYRYMPDSTTVWQLGLVLYGMLNLRRAFASVETICSSYEPPISAELTLSKKQIQNPSPNTILRFYLDCSYIETHRHRIVSVALCSLCNGLT
uniref:non-specific serine/threonine protein kinase n=1 Tax=Neogobius melanostomus TaxID=47308 RepID=A0A8C6S2T1_9GOBI